MTTGCFWILNPTSKKSTV